MPTEEECMRAMWMAYARAHVDMILNPPRMCALKEVHATDDERLMCNRVSFGLRFGNAAEPGRRIG